MARSVDVRQFSMIPRADIPRSTFKMEKTYKTAFDSGYLVPVYVEEILPGDTFNLRATMFGRLATPIFPFIDNLWLDSFFFFVPNRLVWTNWVKFMGEQTNPADSISYLVPVVSSAVLGWPIGSIGDYFGLPTVGQIGAGNVITSCSLPFRGYNLIWNEWFRDENLQNSLPVPLTDGPDVATDFVLQRRGKRKDYFTSALPFPQKGISVPLPLSGNAPVKGLGAVNQVFSGAAGTVYESGASGSTVYANYKVIDPSVAGGQVFMRGTAAAGGFPDVYADLSVVTATTINQLRQSFQIQKLLERDARGGTRYTESVLAHFGVQSPDARLNRPEYLGGGSQRIAINPIAQTSGTPAVGTPQGNLAAMGTVLASNHGFSQSFTEHGYVIGMVMVRADLTYQQGIRRMWSRRTRYDYYFPAFAMLGEQAILRKEIYALGSANDSNVFGYQERWAEYRYNPSEITGLMRSTATGTIDAWHLAQRFTAPPSLNATFIEETPPLSRVLAVGAAANGQQLLLDVFFSVRAARPLPMFSVPGLIDHF